MLNDRVEKLAIYSKGFRGVPDGWHNIKSCNFLVGENSSGKSSFLKLLQIIDSREHVIFMDILGVCEGIDTPFDACSRSTGSNDVSIGFLVKYSDNNKSKKTKDFGRIITYHKVHDTLKVSRSTIFGGQEILQMNKSRKGIGYKFHSFSYDDSLTHVDNGERLEKIHFNPQRFQHGKDVNWADRNDQLVWQELIHSLTSSNEDERIYDYTRFDVPLNSYHYGPIRAKTLRLYHGAQQNFSSSGEHTAYLMKELLALDEGLRNSVEKFGYASGLFDKISITSVKTKVKDKPFALQIEKSGSYYYVDELGYGVGQILPIVADIAFASEKISFLIQQPELHLHPRAQAALGDVFYSRMKIGGVLVIETHSDFIIDRFRMCASGKDTPYQAQILFFQQGADGKNHAHEITIEKDGTISDAPDSYRDFFLNETIDKFEKLS